MELPPTYLPTLKRFLYHVDRDEKDYCSLARLEVLDQKIGWENSIEKLQLWMTVMADIERNNKIKKENDRGKLS